VRRKKTAVGDQRRGPLVESPSKLPHKAAPSRSPAFANSMILSATAETLNPASAGLFLYRLLTVGEPPCRVRPHTPDTDHSKEPRPRAILPRFSWRSVLALPRQLRMPSGSPDRMLRRRKFIRLFSGAVAGGRLRRAQHSVSQRRIGVLTLSKIRPLFCPRYAPRWEAGLAPF
jgi:hypothetical protein